MSIRRKRVSELIQREIAQILQRDYSDQLQPMVTITQAKVTPDLAIATIFASVMGDTKKQREATFRRLEELGPQVREELAGCIRHQLRTVPELRFKLDETFQEAQHMEKLFDRIRKERSRREASDGSEDDQLA